MKTPTTQPIPPELIPTEEDYARREIKEIFDKYIEKNDVSDDVQDELLEQMYYEYSMRENKNEPREISMLQFTPEYLEELADEIDEPEIEPPTM